MKRGLRIYVKESKRDGWNLFKCVDRRIFCVMLKMPSRHCSHISKLPSYLGYWFWMQMQKSLSNALTLIFSQTTRQSANKKLQSWQFRISSYKMKLPEFYCISSSHIIQKKCSRCCQSHPSRMSSKDLYWCLLIELIIRIKLIIGKIIFLYLVLWE